MLGVAGHLVVAVVVVAFITTNASTIGHGLRFVSCLHENLVRDILLFKTRRITVHSVYRQTHTRLLAKARRPQAAPFARPSSS